MIIYVVYLTEYLGDKLPRFYIGSSTKERVLNGYNGSVKSKKYKDIYKEEQRNNKHLFKTEILFECYDREVAIEIEQKYQRITNCIFRDDYMNLALAGGKFGLNLTTKESIQKTLETKRKNGTLGCTKETAKKIVETKRQRGLLKHKPETIEKIKNSMTDENGNWRNNNEKRLKTVLTPDENGMTIAKIGGKNMSITRLNKIHDNGLNDYQVCGLEHSKRMNKILENGETEAKRRGKLCSKTKKENGSSKGANNVKAKKINIYNQNDELMFKCHGNFKETCLNNNLPFKVLRTSYVNNNKIYINSKPFIKEFEKYIGWYAKEVQ